MVGNVLAIDGVTLSFGGLNALSGVSLSVRDGMIHGVIGPNGAGKTTLARILVGLEKADSGNIKYFGLPFKEKFGLLKKTFSIVFLTEILLAF